MGGGPARPERRRRLAGLTLRARPGPRLVRVRAAGTRSSGRSTPAGAVRRRPRARSCPGGLVVRRRSLVASGSPAGAPAAAGGARRCWSSRLDLGLGQRPLVVDRPTRPSSSRVPKAVEVIARGRAGEPVARPLPGPSDADLEPDAGRPTASDDRLSDFVGWERDTIQPKYGLPYGVQYTFTQGVAELYDYEWFFGPFTTRVDPAGGRLPAAGRPERADRLLPAARVRPLEHPLLHPPRLPESGPTPSAGSPRSSTDDRADLPRARGLRRARRRQGAASDWLGTRTSSRPQPQRLPAGLGRPRRPVPPTRSRASSRDERTRPMEEMLYTDDPLWHDPTRHAYDPPLDRLARGRPTEPSLARYLPGGPTGAGEAVDGPRRRARSGSSSRSPSNAPGSSSSPTPSIPAGPSRSTASPPRSSGPTG